MTQTSVGCRKRPTAVMVGPVRMRRCSPYHSPFSPSCWPPARLGRHVDGHRRVQRCLDARVQRHGAHLREPAHRDRRRRGDQERRRRDQRPGGHDTPSAATCVIQSDITVDGAGARTNDHRRRREVERLPRSRRPAPRGSTDYTIRNGAGGGGQIAQGGGIVNQGDRDARPRPRDRARARRRRREPHRRPAGDRPQPDRHATSAAACSTSAAPRSTPRHPDCRSSTRRSPATRERPAPRAASCRPTGPAHRCCARPSPTTPAAVRSPVGGLARPDDRQRADHRQHRGPQPHRAPDVPANCGATRPTDGGANVEDDATCGFTLHAATRGLATQLANAGGETDVLALAATSPAVDRVPTATTAPRARSISAAQARPVGARVRRRRLRVRAAGGRADADADRHAAAHGLADADGHADADRDAEAGPVAGKSVAAVPVAARSWSSCRARRRSRSSTRR